MNIADIALSEALQTIAHLQSRACNLAIALAERDAQLAEAKKLLEVSQKVKRPKKIAENKNAAT